MNELCSFRVLQWGTLYHLTIEAKNLFKMDRFLHNLDINEKEMLSVAIQSYTCTYRHVRKYRVKNILLLIYYENVHFFAGIQES